MTEVTWQGRFATVMALRQESGQSLDRGPNWTRAYFMHTEGHKPVGSWPGNSHCSGNYVCLLVVSNHICTVDMCICIYMYVHTYIAINSYIVI